MENSELITKALSFIKSETGKSDISIEDVASHAGFSTNYFNRIFAAHTGFNVMEYVRFSRLKKAAYLLRTTNRDIIDISLECGYESHGSFTRAFGNQYGKTPSEYRETMMSVENVYGDYHNETTGARIVHEFTQFKIANTDEVIDYILENDALRHGYMAICAIMNGGAAVYDGDNISDGFIWFSEWDNNFEGCIFCDRYDKIAQYQKIFADKHFTMVFYSMDDEAKIKAELISRGVTVNNIIRTPNRIYRGEPIECVSPDGYSMRELFYDDCSMIEEYCKKAGCFNTWAKRLLENFRQRDVLGNKEHSLFVFGIFDGDELIGLSLGGLQRAHSFIMNNCIETSVIKEHQSEELYRYAYCFVTNAALEKGAVPFDDMQYTGAPHKSGNFDSTELGYETITNVCVIK